MYAFFKSNRRVIAGSTIAAATLVLVYAFTLAPPSPLTVPTRVALDSAQKPIGGPVTRQKMPCSQSVEGCDHLAAPALPRGTLPSAASLGAASPASLEMNDGLQGSNTAADSADKAKSVTALQYAADQGHLAAQWKVGRMYAAGDGVPHDDLRAFVYFSQIANTHPDEPPGTGQAHIVAKAFVALGRYYLTGIPNSAVAQDAARARELFVYAASYFGDTDAQYQLGRLYLDGSPSNPLQAARWFQLAATKGDCRAEAVLGDMLFQGQKVPRQAAHGLMWLTLSKDCAGPEENWIKQLYDNALRRASIDERVMALVFLEDWLKERARDANG
jgi:TPR repeat protein